MYRSPLSLLYFLENSLAILVWHLSQIPRLIVSVIFMGLLTGLFMTSTAAQNTQANTDAASPFGLTVRQGWCKIWLALQPTAKASHLFMNPLSRCLIRSLQRQASQLKLFPA